MSATQSIAQPNSRAAAPLAAKTRVLGLGNDLLSDDGVGYAVVTQVARKCAHRHDVDCLQSAAVGWALLDDILGFETVIIVDAIVTGAAPPGHLHEIDPRQLPPRTVSAPHRVGLPEALKLAAALGLPLPRDLKVFAVEILDGETFGTQLTSPVAAAVPAIAARIMAEIESMTHRTSTAV